MEFNLQEDKIHKIVAAMRFPGPDYIEVLRWLHEERKPLSYVEIGVGNGDSLQLARPPTVALGIDPIPNVDCSWRTTTQIASMTSREFFARHKLREFLGMDCFSLAFIDGLHRFEEVIHELLQLEKSSSCHSVIALHDTIPLNADTSQRERRTLFYTGDVWKIIPFLKQHRPDLEMITVKTGPSGLTLIKRLNASWEVPASDWTEALTEFAELQWDYCERHREEFLETIPNSREVVLNWLQPPTNVHIQA